MRVELHGTQSREALQIKPWHSMVKDEATTAIHETHAGLERPHKAHQEPHTQARGGRTQIGSPEDKPSAGLRNRRPHALARTGSTERERGKLDSQTRALSQQKRDREPPHLHTEGDSSNQEQHGKNTDEQRKKRSEPTYVACSLRT